MSNITPKKLAIYYGWPSAVNGAGGDVATAVNTYKDYKLVIFGQGLENDSHPDHANTTAIINHPDMANTQTFGYVDATLDLDDIQVKIDLWGSMGVNGIFVDQFGYDYGVSRNKQRSIVWSIHHTHSGNTDNHLKAFVNAWNADHAFGSDVDPVNNPTGKDTRLNSNDWYLAESFAVMDGNYDDSDYDANNVKDWQDKAIKLVNYRTQKGTKIAAVATGGNIPFDQSKADYSYYAAALNGFDAWGWGEEFYSASSASLPYHDRAAIHGNNFTGNITNTAGVLQRQTNVGIKIDTNTHQIGAILN